MKLFCFSNHALVTKKLSPVFLNFFAFLTTMFLSSCSGGNPIEEKAEISCENYCAFYSNACAFEYESVMDCQTQCAVFPVSENSDSITGDNLECRFNQARNAYRIMQGSAVGNQNQSCEAAAFNGGGVCGPHIGIVDRAANPAVVFLLPSEEDRARFNQTDPFLPNMFEGIIQTQIDTLDALDGEDGNVQTVVINNRQEEFSLAEIFSKDVITLNISNDCNPGFFSLEILPNDSDNCGGRTLNEDVYDVLLQQYLIGPEATDGISENDLPFTPEFPYLPR